MVHLSLPLSTEIEDMHNHPVIKKREKKMTQSWMGREGEVDLGRVGERGEYNQNIHEILKEIIKARYDLHAYNPNTQKA